MSDNRHHDALIGKIYDTSLMPGDWVDLLDTIASWTGGQPDTCLLYTSPSPRD